MIIAVNFPIEAIGKKKPEKKNIIRASTGFEPVTSALLVFVKQRNNNNNK